MRRSIILFAGIGLSIPTGVVLASLLSRRLGPELYGLLTVTNSVVYWLELGSTQLFARTAVRFIAAAEGETWRGVAATLLRAQGMVSILAALLAVLLTPLLARLLNAPLLVLTLPILALDIPLYGLAQVQGSALIGRGRAWKRSSLFAVRWVGRFVWIMLFLAVGFSIYASLLGYLLASALEMLLAARYLRVSFRLRPEQPLRGLFAFALPIWFYTVGLELFNTVDLWSVQALLPGPAAGYYAAAQYLTIMADLIAASISPVLIGSITQQLANGQNAAKSIRSAFQFILSLMPFVALAAASAAPLLSLIYEPVYRSAAPVLAVLLIGSIGVMLIVIGTAVLVALHRPVWTGALAVLLVPLAVVGHALVVRNGNIFGAALVTAALAWVGGLTVMLAACRESGAILPYTSLARALLLSVAGYAVSALWWVEGWPVLIKLSLLSLPLAGIALVAGDWPHPGRWLPNRFKGRSRPRTSYRL